MIEGVMVRTLNQIHDERGYLMEILRNDDPEFKNNFGQVYVSAVYRGVIKAWHLHHAQTDRVCCISGRIRLGMVDVRSNSSTKGNTEDMVIGDGNPKIITIPYGILHGWKGLTDTALVINVPDKPYCYENPDEDRVRKDVTRLSGLDINFDWSLRHG